MSLKETKELLKVDQTNIFTAEVVSDSDLFATIRTPDGRQVRAAKPRGSEFSSGAYVDVRTDTKTHVIMSASSYSGYAAEVVFLL